MARAPRAGDPQRGAVAVVVAFSMVMLLGFAALTIDGGRNLRARAELQNASDAAALAAAQQLDRTYDGLVRSREAAHEIALRHGAHDSAVALHDADIVFGHWDEAERTFTSLGTAPSEPGAVNAVQVIDRRQEQTGNAIPSTLAHFIGRDHTDVNSEAIAVGGGPASECGFPMVVSDCQLQEPIDDGTCDYCMKFQDNGSDNAGWTSFEIGRVGGPKIAALVKQSCYDANGKVSIDPTTGECNGGCVDLDSGAEIQVNNGNNMNQGANNFCPVLEDILRRGKKNGVAQPFVVTVPVLESEEGTCSGSHFAGHKTIAGFAKMEILGVKCAKSSPAVIAPGAQSCAPPPSEKYVVGRLRCDLQSTEVAGGGYYGLMTRRTRLVR